jgi:5,10-methylenetetrahydromethanopterin reductase
VLAEKIAYYGPSLSPLILERLALTHEDFEPIEQAVMAENDMDRACQLVDERMLRIGMMGDAGELINRLEPLVAAGATHLSFGPPLGPDPLAAVTLLGQQVISRFREVFVTDHTRAHPAPPLGSQLRPEGESDAATSTITPASHAPG